jgi:hypothetical protein
MHGDFIGIIFKTEIMKNILILLLLISSFSFGQILTNKDSICAQRGHIWIVVSEKPVPYQYEIIDYPDSTIKSMSNGDIVLKVCERCSQIKEFTTPNEKVTIWRSSKYMRYLDSIQKQIHFPSFTWTE